MRLRFIVTLLFLPWPAAAAAQQPSVPMDLARALLAGSGFEPHSWVEVVVAGPPTRFKVDSLAGMRLLGSAGFPNSATLIYAVDGELDAARAAATEQLKAAGWQPARRTERSAFVEIGFLPSDMPMGFDDRAILCQPDRSVMVIPLQIVGGPRVLRVLYMGNQMAGLCNPPPTMGRPRDPWLEAPIPRLEPPVEARIRPAGRGGGMETYSVSAFAMTTMSNEKLIDHYAAQMVAAGWQAGDKAARRSAAIHTFRIKHNNADWAATLVSTSASDELRVLELTVHNATEITKRGW